MSLMPWFGRGMDPFSSDLWDPFGASWPWDAAVSRRGDGNRDDDSTAVARTNVDWRETDKEHIFSAEIPGVRKEDVKVEVEDGNVLKISGEKTREVEEQKQGDGGGGGGSGGGAWNRVERSFGSFLRRFRLPDNARADASRCTLQDGVLRVVVPKDDDAARKQRNVRSIDIS